MAEVKLDAVSKIFPDGTRAVDEMSLAVADGELCVLVGPSGCGKSTALRMIAGLEELTSGEIRIGGERVNDLPPKRRDVAMVFQNYALYPHMTVRENLAFALKLRKTPAKERATRVDQAARMLGLDDLLERKPAALSGGQQQRVALGRAIVREPACFLFDEPLSNLDAKLRVDMRAQIKQLHQRLNATSIYVTHDQEEAMTLGDRLVVMRSGRVQQHGRPLEIYNHPANRFVAGFIGLPTMNFVDGTINRQDDTIRFEGGDVTAVLDMPPNVNSFPHAVTLGVRPSALSLIEPNSAGISCVAHVEVVEPIGDRQDVFLKSKNGQLLAARVKADVNVSIGMQVGVAMDRRQLHLFETAGDQRSLTRRPDTQVHSTMETSDGI
ncbi:MAG: sn-glycerol-3-phosphate ABC transporter ATP-binding protein UgpC [Pirellulales bacterium]|nr:sn-glycerol-3-phosphate ABC transporter ATP-binding protein UgpC [Pirellulales bacterium]